MPREGTETFIYIVDTIFFVLNLEIRCPERGRKQFTTISPKTTFLIFGNKMPREGTETNQKFCCMCLNWNNLEIRCPERGRKLCLDLYPFVISLSLFGNKMPREGTETFLNFSFLS